jgi:hypothetical protein
VNRLFELIDGEIVEKAPAEEHAFSQHGSAEKSTYISSSIPLDVLV